MNLEMRSILQDPEGNDSERRKEKRMTYRDATHLKIVIINDHSISLR